MRLDKTIFIDFMFVRNVNALTNASFYSSLSVFYDCLGVNNILAQLGVVYVLGYFISLCLS